MVGEPAAPAPTSCAYLEHDKHMEAHYPRTWMDVLPLAHYLIFDNRLMRFPPPDHASFAAPVVEKTPVGSFLRFFRLAFLEPLFIIDITKAPVDSYMETRSTGHIRETK